MKSHAEIGIFLEHNLTFLPYPPIRTLHLFSIFLLFRSYVFLQSAFSISIPSTLAHIQRVNGGLSRALLPGGQAYGDFRTVEIKPNAAAGGALPAVYGEAGFMGAGQTVGVSLSTENPLPTIVNKPKDPALPYPGVAWASKPTGESPDTSDKSSAAPKTETDAGSDKVPSCRFNILFTCPRKAHGASLLGIRLWGHLVDTCGWWMSFASLPLSSPVPLCSLPLVS